jgi:hypothetical protein
LVAEEWDDKEVVQFVSQALLAWFSVCGAIFRASVDYWAKPNLATIDV